MKINYHQLSIRQLHELLKTKTITHVELINLVYQRLAKWKKLNAVTTTLEKETLAATKLLDIKNLPVDNLLWAIPFVTKDNIATINTLTTSSSNILTNFVPNYNSTVIELLTNKNALNIAKTALDELGMGGDGLYANTGFVYNPWHQDHITGGSSSGSAALVATGVVPFALGTDTGDSIRKPAAFCGIIGFKPTYGLISRYGLFPYAPSLDTIGLFANNIEDIAIVFDEIAKYDKKDATSVISKQQNYTENLTTNVKNKKIAILNYDQYKWTIDIKTSFDETLTALTNAGCKIEKITFPTELLQSLLWVYMIISFAEATSCNANLTGINFGVRQKGENYQQVMTNSRTAGFGTMVKKRFMIGAYALANNNQDHLFLQAKKIRRLIVDELNYLFKKFDAFIIMPSVNPAPTIKQTLTNNTIFDLSVERDYLEDLLLLSNFNGGPSITIPLTLSNGLPIGININSAPFNDQTALDIAYFLSKKINFNNKLLGDENE